MVGVAIRGALHVAGRPTVCATVVGAGVIATLLRAVVDISYHTCDVVLAAVLTVTTAVGGAFVGILPRVRIPRAAAHRVGLWTFLLAVSAILLLAVSAALEPLRGALLARSMAPRVLSVFIVLAIASASLALTFSVASRTLSEIIAWDADVRRRNDSAPDMRWAAVVGLSVGIVCASLTSSLSAAAVLIGLLLFPAAIIALLAPVAHVEIGSAREGSGPDDRALAATRTGLTAHWPRPRRRIVGGALFGVVAAVWLAAGFAQTPPQLWQIERDRDATVHASPNESWDVAPADAARVALRGADRAARARLGNIDLLPTCDALIFELPNEDAFPMDVDDAYRLIGRALSAVRPGGRLVIPLGAPELADAAIERYKRDERAVRWQPCYLRLRLNTGVAGRTGEWLVCGADVPQWLARTASLDSAASTLLPVHGHSHLRSLRAAELSATAEPFSDGQ